MGIVKRLLFLILFSTLLFPQSKMGDIQSKFNSLKNFKVNFTQLQNGREVLKGVFYYRNNGSMRIELSSYEMITDGKTVWNFNKKQNKVIISDYSDEDASMLSLRKVINDYPAVCNVTESNANGRTEIKLVPRDNSLNFSEAVIIPSDNGLVGSMRITSGTSLFEVRLSQYQINIKLADELFTFTPSERIKVIDLR